MKKCIVIILVVILSHSTSSYAQLNTFFDGWIPVPYLPPASTTPVSAPVGTETVTITIDAANEINKVYPTHFGNNAASWVSKGMLTDGIRLPHLQRANLSLLRWPDGSGSDEFFWDGNVPPSFLSDPKLTPTNGTEPWRLKSQDIVNLTSSIGGSPLVVVNFGYAIYGDNADPIGTAAHYAADFVRHMNGTLGANVKYWEVGNENYGPWEAGHTVNGVKLTGTKYGQIFRVFVDSMKKADPTIKIGAVLYTDDVGYNNWSALVLPEVQNHADFLSIHEYFHPSTVPSTTTYPQMMAAIPKVIDNYNAVQTMVQTYTSKPKDYFPIAMTEFNSRVGMRKIAMANALFFPRFWATP